MNRLPHENKLPPEHNNKNVPAVVVTSLGVIFAHVFWLLIGPGFAAVLLYVIAISSSGWITSLDIALLVVVLAMLVARWLEHRSGQAVNIYGEPASWADFRRYMFRLPIVVALFWFTANIIGNYF